MTKAEVEYIVKRYSYVNQAIKRGLSETSFYTGNRKITIIITEEVKKICEVVDIIYEQEPDENIRKIIHGIKTGEKDIRIIHFVPYEKNAYYVRKDAFLQKVYNCCVALNIVSFEEILNESIA